MTPRTMNIYSATLLSLVVRVAMITGLLSLAACGGGDSGAPPAQAALFSKLGFPSGFASSQASAISADGFVVAGTATTVDGKSEAFRWSAKDGMSEIGYLPGGVRSMASGVSADGSVIVGSGDTTSAPVTPVSGFRWMLSTGVVRIDPIPGSYLCSPSGVSGDGATVSGTCLTTNSEGFRWTHGTGSIGLGRFGGGSDATSSATAVSSDGAVIVGAGHPLLTGAVAWPLAEKVLVIGKLPGAASASALAVSRDGSVVVGASMDNAQVTQAFRWERQAGIVPLATMAAGIQGSVAAAISGDGTIIAGWAITGTGEAAFIWDAERGMRLLEAVLAVDYQTEIAGWKLTRATAISDDGRTIAGYGTNPQGQVEAWIAKLPQAR